MRMFIDFWEASMSITEEETYPELTLELKQELDRLQKSIFEVLRESGLVGCFEGSPDLSTNYKAIVREYIEQKHHKNSPF